MENINFVPKGVQRILSSNKILEKFNEQVFYKKIVLNNMSIFTGKYLCCFFFNKNAGLQACNFIKKRLKHRCFPANTTKFLRTPILKNICERMLLGVFPFMSV